MQINSVLSENLEYLQLVFPDADFVGAGGGVLEGAGLGGGEVAGGTKEVVVYAQGGLVTVLEVAVRVVGFLQHGGVHGFGLGAVPGGVKGVFEVDAIVLVD